MITTRKVMAFTLVEILVVIGVIGLIVGLLLPAVQAAREASRRSYCNNNLKQIGLSIQMHHDSHKQLPTDGWGGAWVGDPAYGFGEEQPGGWIFNLLPYLEQESQRNTAKGFDPVSRRVELQKMLSMAVSNFNCPGRRAALAYPYLSGIPLRNSEMPSYVAKSDYAVNGGSVALNSGEGPLSHSDQDVSAYAWPPIIDFDGVSFVRSKVRFADVTDGLSNTYLVGEKYISVSDPSGFGGDDQAMLIGDDADIRRWGSGPPLSDHQKSENRRAFGSRHSSGCGFVFIDGSVHNVAFAIDEEVHRILSGRRDGLIAHFPE